MRTRLHRVGLIFHFQSQLLFFNHKQVLVLVTCSVYSVAVFAHSTFSPFLLIARYVPNVAKRSIWDQCKKKYILRTDQRPATDDDDRPHIWENFKWPYLREGSSDPLHVWFYGGVFEVGGSNGSISGLNKFNRYMGENNVRGVIRLATV